MKKDAKQVAAWARLLGHCHTLGDSYNPSKDSLKRTAMEHLLTESQKTVEAVHNATGALAHAKAERRQKVEMLPLIATRVVKELKFGKAPKEHLENVNRIRKGFRYQPQPEEVVTVQTSSPGGQAGQMVTEDASSTPERRRPGKGIISRIDSFDMLIKILENGPAYQPNEDDLTIAALKAFAEDLKQKQATVVLAEATLQHAKEKCKALLYDTDGMHGLSLMVKHHINLKFGGGSEAYKKVSKIKFVG